MIALFLIIMLALFTQNGNIFERNSLKFQRFPNVVPVCRGVSFVFRKVLSGGSPLSERTIRKQGSLRAQIDFWSKLEYLSDIRWSRRHFVEHSYNFVCFGGLWPILYAIYNRTIRTESDLMPLQFCSFASGSSGNCYLIKNQRSAILIDAGISGKKIFQGLEETGTPFEAVSAVLVTHEHIDHVKSLPIVTKKLPNVLAWANRQTWEHIERPVAEGCRRVFTTGEDFQIDDFRIRPFAIPHDAAEPVGFSIYYDGRQISIVTDVGCITDEIFEEITNADLLLLEANHEKEILLMGRYPYNLKRRILGDHGHLSNVSAGTCLCRLVGKKKKRRRVLLGHLSRENNDPSVAMLTITNTLQEQDIFPGDELSLEVMLRDSCSCVYEV